MRRLVWLAMLAGLLILPAGADTNRVAAVNLKVWVDRDLYELLPDKYLFENLPSRLFRSRDGRTLYLGPAAEKQYYAVQGPGRVKKLEAPSNGKAYQDERGRFVIWYDSLNEGVHFDGGYTLRLSKPRASRFGVSYGAEFFYLYDGTKSEVFARTEPTRPLIRLDGHYVYKIAGDRDNLFVFSFRRLKSESVRRHMLLAFREIKGAYVEMKRYDLPDHLSTMDVDVARKKVLMLNDSEMAPQAIEYDLVKSTWRNYGIVDYFALYLDAGFFNESAHVDEKTAPQPAGRAAKP